MIKNLPARAKDMGDTGSIPGLGRSPGVENGNPLQYSCLGNSTGGAAWWAPQSVGLQRESNVTGTGHGCTRSVDQHKKGNFKPRNLSKLEEY